MTELKPCPFCGGKASAAVTIIDYAANEHPYSKERDKPETWTQYNQGWNDACDYIWNKLEEKPVAEFATVRHGKWEWDTEDMYRCSSCGETAKVKEVMGKPVWEYCPNCGARMDLEGK